MTQRELILDMLKARPRCGTEFLDEHIARYSARIYELRQDGWQIKSVLCKAHKHRSPQRIFFLADRTDDDLMDQWMEQS